MTGACVMAIKKCSSCDFECDIEIAKNYFHKDKYRSSGYTSKCKKCKYEYDISRAKHNRYKDLDVHIKNKYLLRFQARKMKKEIDCCSVIGCKESPELHHIDYKSNGSVVPLCRDHHSKIHSLEYQLESSLSDYSNMVNGIKLKDARIIELESELKKRDELLRDLVQLVQDIAKDEIVYFDAKIRCRDKIEKPEIKAILEGK